MLLQPLRARPGARFTCHGDGLCCTDVHVIGPLDDSSADALVKLEPACVVEHEDERFVVHGLRGECVFLRADGCSLHAELGRTAKPDACRQFPFSLVATPLGGRVSTRHYCPCRTMGERAAVDPAEALAACGGGPADRRIHDRMAYDEERAIGMAEWEQLESELLGRLARGEAPERVLGAEPYAERTPGQWERIARASCDAVGGHFEAAQRVFGAMLLDALGLSRADASIELPWRDVFDRAEERSAPSSPEAMLADFVADALWSLEWAFLGTYRQACADLVSRVDLARRIAARVGGRPDRAMAEAIAVVDLVGLDPDYQIFVGELPT